MNDLITDSFVAAAAKAKPQPSSASTSTAGDDALRQFLADAEAASQELSSLRTDLAGLEQQSSSSISSSDPAVLSLLRRARALRSKLASMDGGHSRAAANISAGLRSRLGGLTADIAALQRRISLDRRSAVARYYAAVAGEAPSEEVLDRLVAGDRGEKDVIKSSIGAAAVAEIDGEMHAAKEVEASLMELQQLFLDMAVMVDAQGKDLDDIEKNVAAAGSEVHSGVEELSEARRQQRSGRRKCVVIAVVAVLVVLIAAAAIVVAVLLSKKSSLVKPVELDLQW